MSYDEEHIFAEYNNFSLGPESDNYRLYVSGYSDVSTAGTKNFSCSYQLEYYNDGFCISDKCHIDLGDSLSYHNMMMFSTLG